MITDDIATTLPSRDPIEFVACEHLYHLGEFQVLVFGSKTLFYGFYFLQFCSHLYV
jgi:hypothetical protein